MKTQSLSLIAVALFAMVGCAYHPAIIVTTQTGLGVTIAQNPTTQLYEGKIGFVRNEFGYIPINATNANQAANVMMELKYNNLFSGGGIYQRLAVGDIAVSQPGAALLFAKDASGNITTNSLLNAIPNLPNLLLKNPQH